MRTHRLLKSFLLAMLVLGGCSDEDKQPAAASSPAATPVAEGAAPVTPAKPAAPATRKAVFTQEELDQMLAPLALYPDALLAQILMAATYPGDVADAVAWSKAHPDNSGDTAVQAVAEQPWDPSVQSLVAFPAALAVLGQDLAWVQRVGDAFLAEPDAVMDSVQRLRHKAKEAGHLESNEQQQVTEEPAAPATVTSGSVEVVQQPSTIIIEPTQPQVIYVPNYNPSVVYGTWPYPSPPVYYPPPPGYYFGGALAAGLGFAAGVAIIDSIWGAVIGTTATSTSTSTVTTTSTVTGRSITPKTNGSTTPSIVMGCRIVTRPIVKNSASAYLAVNNAMPFVAVITPAWMIASEPVSPCNSAVSTLRRPATARPVSAPR